MCEATIEEAQRFANIIEHHYDLVIPEILIVEVMVGLVEDANRAKLHSHEKMRLFIQRRKEFWLTPPRQVMMEELVLKIRPLTKWIAGPEIERQSRMLDNPSAPESVFWCQERRRAKNQLVTNLKSLQAIDVENLPADYLQISNLADFAPRLLGLYLALLDSPQRKICLNHYIGQPLKDRYPDMVEAIDNALESLTFESLETIQNTKNYIVLELAYEMAPSFTLPGGEKLIRAKSKYQVNNFDDKLYLASAFRCNCLITCDKDMHTIAQTFANRGLWTGQSILIPQKGFKEYMSSLEST